MPPPLKASLVRNGGDAAAEVLRIVDCPETCCHRSIRQKIPPIGKPPPEAVRLEEALPSRRAQGNEERRALNRRPPAYS
jgi:hypothetical protein